MYKYNQQIEQSYLIEKLTVSNSKFGGQLIEKEYKIKNLQNEVLILSKALGEKVKFIEDLENQIIDMQIEIYNVKLKITHK
jgi:predicted  nucleic acid-binding Zn-ribbon protein